MLLLFFCDIMECLVTLSKVSYLIKDTANKKKYITTSGRTGELGDNTKDQVIFHMYSLPDVSRPFSIVSYDDKKVMIVNENREIIFVDTVLFTSYEQNKVRCDFRKNADERICTRLMNILDPKEEYKDNPEEEDADSIKKILTSGTEKTLKDIRLESFFIWSVSISNKYGGQKIIHKKTGFCLTSQKGKLKIESCDLKHQHNSWKLKEFREAILEKQIEDEAIRIYSENVLSQLRQKRDHCDDSDERSSCDCDEYPQRKHKKHKRHVIVGATNYRNLVNPYGQMNYQTQNYMNQIPTNTMQGVYSQSNPYLINQVE
ncbi:hypothetical protein NBO_462g0008 [Nosema bombycis CQ1]|uniref:Ricin B lectin n=1 Tax=Nosema bombycis (strain CQ1 / CVCC 102059) TaxID=578461 RepID=R0M2U9_NOSB1|nr:hypothetical protein NBO_462g0008 [Nosema bombycis CQ1]WGJ64398.1 ricin B lectin-like protein [Nosema bombycis]|eukprot:EOB12339.1 hypothetical protein NBO_462g0008 [Nosema bombycis CQ1]